MPDACAIPLTPPPLTDFTSLAFRDLLARYAIGVENFDRRVFQLRDGQADMAFLPEAGAGRWPVRAVVGHIADAELYNTVRLRKAIAEESPIESPWDPDAYIDVGLYGHPDAGAGRAMPIAGFVAVIHTLRKWSLDWLRDLRPEQLARRSFHPNHGERTVQGLLAFTTWHLEHHAAFLNRKVGRLLGPMTPESCGPGCGCHGDARG